MSLCSGIIYSITLKAATCCIHPFNNVEGENYGFSHYIVTPIMIMEERYSEI